MRSYRQLPGRSALTMLAMGLLGSMAHAQGHPDAGSLLQQIERDRQLQIPERISPEKKAAPPALKETGGVAVTVKEFRFAGNTLLSREQLEPAVAPYLGRPLGFPELQAAAAAVAEVYRAAGWVVRVYLPEQDIKEGIVTIQIVEAVFGRLILEGTPLKRIDPAAVSAIFAAQQKPGELLNAERLDRALLLADDLPGVTVAGRLQTGAKPSETDLAVKLADEPLFIGEAAINNAGSRSTGAEQVLASAAVNSPLGVGDLLSINGLYTAGSTYARLAYSIPLGSDGWRVGASGAQLNYRLVAPQFSALRAKGTSDTLGLEMSYPIVRSRLKNLFLTLNYDHKGFNNESAGTTISRYKIDVFSAALSGNLFDSLGGGGANAASLAYLAGRVDLDGSPNRAADAATTRTEGSYGKLRWALSRQQVITEDLTFFAAGSGQRASKNLDSSEKFYLGGANGVRAYPVNEGGGSEGEMLNLELRWKLPEGTTLFAFHDWGRVTVNRNNHFAGAAGLNSFSLKGNGLGLAWTAPGGINLKAVWARRQGNNPNPTAAGNDQDGSLVRDRIWLTANLQL